MENPNQELLDLKAKHKLTDIDIGRLCRASRATVHYWTRNPSIPEFKKIKSVYLRLLKLELGEARRQRKIGVKRYRLETAVLP